MKYTYSGEELSKSEIPSSAAAKGQYADVPRKRSRALLLFMMVFIAGVVGGVWWLLSSENGTKPSCGELREAGQDGVTNVASAGFSARNATDEELTLYLESTAGEARQLFEYVRQSAFVQENGQYAALMKDVEFVFDATNDQVNAVASRRVDEEGVESRLITCFAGEMRFSRTIALAAAAELAGHKGAVKMMMDELSPRLCGELSLNDAAKLVRNCGIDRYLADEAVLSKAKSIGAGCVVGTLAHEIGHHVLGHNFQYGKDRINNEINRNCENQSDLFASSVMSSSPFGEYIFAGRAFALWVRMRQTDPILEQIPERSLSHPINRERFVNLVLANKEKAVALGIVLPDLDND